MDPRRPGAAAQGRGLDQPHLLRARDLQADRASVDRRRPHGEGARDAARAGDAVPLPLAPRVGDEPGRELPHTAAAGPAGRCSASPTPPTPTDFSFRSSATTSRSSMPCAARTRISGSTWATRSTPIRRCERAAGLTPFAMTLDEYRAAYRFNRSHRRASESAAIDIDLRGLGRPRGAQRLRRADGRPRPLRQRSQGLRREHAAARAQSARGSDLRGRSHVPRLPLGQRDRHHHPRRALLPQSAGHQRLFARARPGGSRTDDASASSARASHRCCPRIRRPAA